MILSLIQHQPFSYGINLNKTKHVKKYDCSDSGLTSRIKTGLWVKGGADPLCPSDISPKYNDENLGGGFNGQLFGFGGELHHANTCPTKNGTVGEPVPFLIRLLFSQVMKLLARQYGTRSKVRRSMLPEQCAICL